MNIIFIKLYNIYYLIVLNYVYEILSFMNKCEDFILVMSDQKKYLEILSTQPVYSF